MKYIIQAIEIGDVTTQTKTVIDWELVIYDDETKKITREKVKEEQER
jgi:hypothetical protein